jgi:alpha,alpha-trehalose phosphorylase (configuration-retaining)
LGVSANKSEDGNSAEVAIAVRDSTYLLDFSVDHFDIDEDSSDEEDTIADHVISVIQKYEHEHFVKFIGAGLPAKLKQMCPTLCSRLWLETDIIPVVVAASAKTGKFWETKDVDEQADSMGRKCLT